MMTLSDTQPTTQDATIMAAAYEAAPIALFLTY
jgi:hypothetical protein